MSNDENNKAGGWFSNPLPIVMVVLLAAGVLVKNVPLESARPIDPERVKFVATSQQDVEARLLGGVYWPAFGRFGRSGRRSANLF